MDKPWKWIVYGLKADFLIVLYIYILWTEMTTFCSIGTKKVDPREFWRNLNQQKWIQKSNYHQQHWGDFSADNVGISMIDAVFCAYSSYLLPTKSQCGKDNHQLSPFLDHTQQIPFSDGFWPHMSASSISWCGVRKWFHWSQRVSFWNIFDPK